MSDRSRAAKLTLFQASNIQYDRGRHLDWYHFRAALCATPTSTRQTGDRIGDRQKSDIKTATIRLKIESMGLFIYGEADREVVGSIGATSAPPHNCPPIHCLVLRTVVVTFVHPNS